MKGTHTGQASTRRKQRWLIAALLVVTAFIAMPSFASADTGTGTPTVATDQLSYTPGGVMGLSGAGFVAGDTVTVTLADSLSGATLGSAIIPVSSDGTFTGVSFALPSSFDATLTATATDTATGDTASLGVMETMSLPDLTPTVTTDQLDYAPGSVVTISGAGWPAGDTVSVLTNDSDTNSWSQTDQVTADTSGDFTDKVTLPLMFVANYKVTASDAAGLTATTLFTDGTIKVKSASGHDFDFASTLYSSSTDCTGSAGTPAPATANGNPGANVGVGNNQSILITANSFANSPNSSVGFTNWTLGSLALATGYSATDRTICVVGFQSGNTDLIGNYTTVNNASIAGTLYNDANGNGSQDTGESGKSGVTVFIDSNNNGVKDNGEPSTTTDTSGAYSFTGLAAGTYTVDYQVTSGWANTGTKPLSVTVTAGQNATGKNFFEAQQYTVTLGQTGVGSDTGTNTVVTVNGTPYQATDLPKSLTFTSGATVTYSFSTPIATSPASGTRYVLDTTTGPASGFVVSGTTSVTGNYKTQFQLTLATAPGAANIPLTAITGASDGDWFDTSTVVNLTAAQDELQSGGSRYHFDHWSGDSATPRSTPR